MLLVSSRRQDMGRRVRGSHTVGHRAGQSSTRSRTRAGQSSTYSRTQGRSVYSTKRRTQGRSVYSTNRRTQGRSV